MTDTEHKNRTTRAYLRYGLPHTMRPEMVKAWEDHQAGRSAPLRLLPTNGDRCEVPTMGGAVCGWPLLIDGSCPARNEHAYCGDPVFSIFGGPPDRCLLEHGHVGPCDDR